MLTPLLLMVYAGACIAVAAFLRVLDRRESNRPWAVQRLYLSTGRRSYYRGSFGFLVVGLMSICASLLNDHRFQLYMLVITVLMIYWLSLEARSLRSQRGIFSHVEDESSSVLSEGS